jgi:hypothetical protein
VFAVVGREWCLHVVPRWSSLALPKTTSFTIAESKIWGALCQQVHVRSFVLIFEPKGRRLLVASTASFVGALGSLSLFVPFLVDTAQQLRTLCAPPGPRPVRRSRRRRRRRGKAAGDCVRCVCEGGVVMSKKAHKQVGSLVWDRVGDRLLTAHTPY